MSKSTKPPVTQKELDRDLADHVRHTEDLKSQQETMEAEELVEAAASAVSTDKAPEHYVLRSLSDIQVGFPVPTSGGKVRVNLNFANGTCVITPDLAEMFGCTVEQLVDVFVKKVQNRDYQLVAGPGVKKTDEMRAFDLRAQRAADLRASRVTVITGTRALDK